MSFDEQYEKIQTLIAAEKERLIANKIGFNQQQIIAEEAYEVSKSVKGGIFNPLVQFINGLKHSELRVMDVIKDIEKGLVSLSVGERKSDMDFASAIYSLSVDDHGAKLRLLDGRGKDIAPEIRDRHVEHVFNSFSKLPLEAMRHHQPLFNEKLMPGSGNNVDELTAMLERGDEREIALIARNIDAYAAISEQTRGSELVFQKRVIDIFNQAAGKLSPIQGELKTSDLLKLHEWNEYGGLSNYVERQIALQAATKHFADRISDNELAKFQRMDEMLDFVWLYQPEKETLAKLFADRLPEFKVSDMIELNKTLGFNGSGEKTPRQECYGDWIDLSTQAIAADRERRFGANKDDVKP